MDEHPKKRGRAQVVWETLSQTLLGDEGKGGASPLGWQELVQAMDEMPLGFGLARREEGLPVLYANRALARNAGVDRSELMGERLLRWLEPAPESAQVGTQSGETVLDRVYIRRLATAPPQYVRLRVIPMDDRENGRSPYLLTLTNVTCIVEARKRLDDELRHLRGFMESSVAAVTVLSPEGEIEYCNARAREILGFDVEDIEGRRYNDPEWRHEDLEGRPLSEERQPFQIVRRTLKPLSDYRHVITWPDGRRRVLSIYGAPVFDAEGNLENLVFQIIDVTTQHETTAALLKSETLLRAMLDNVPSIIWTSDLENFVDSVNQEAVEFTGVEMEKLLGYGWRDYVHPDDLHQWPSGIAVALREKETHENEIRVLGRDGAYHWFYQRASVLRNEAGERVGLVGAMANIDERKRAVEQQIALEREISEAQKLASLRLMAAGVAHDFRNLMVSVRGSAELLQMQSTIGSEDQELVSSILAASSRAAELCDQMMIYSGREKRGAERMSPHKVASEMMPLLRTMARRCTLRLDVHDDLPDIHADAGQFRQVLMNLVLNACDAIEHDKGSITIRLEMVDLTSFAGGEAFTFATIFDGTETRGIALVVEDNGRGMEKDVAQRIFEPFFSTKEEGRGLGMASVLEIMRHNGGGVGVRTEPGRGTAVHAVFRMA